MMHFLYPFAFLLLPAPWLVRHFFKPAPLGKSGALRIPFFKSLDDAGASSRGMRRSVRPWRWLTMSAIWLLLVIAAARPMYLGDEVALPVDSRDLMFAIDLSGSMGREDFALDGRISDRLAVVKSTADDFIERRVGDRVGLIFFSDRAYVQAPLTLDRHVVRQLLDEAQVGLTGQETAIGDAIAIAVKRLKDRPVENRVLVLMTDGASNAGMLEPMQAAAIAKDVGIRIYTIGVGAEQMAINTRVGRRIVNPAEDLDEETLNAIAELTGGQYFRATDTQGMAGIYQELDALEPVTDEPLYAQPTVGLFHWPLAAAALLCIVFSMSLLNPGFQHGFRSHTLGEIS